MFDIPNGCAPEFQAQCLTDYLNAYVAHDTHTSLTTSNVNCCALELPHLTMPRGGVADPQIVLADCGGLRKLCDESFLAPASEGLREPSPLPSFVRVNQSFGALISLCDCVVADQPVQCEFTASRTVFLLLGIFAIFLFEVRVWFKAHMADNVEGVKGFIPCSAANRVWLLVPLLHPLSFDLQPRVV